MVNPARERLKRRADFKAVAGGRRVARAGFVLQARKAESEAGGEADTGPREARFGFTVTKKTGNAVVRNRIRRRLREAVRLMENGRVERNTDYVLVGRRAALTLQFERLVTDLVSGLEILSRPEKSPERTPVDAR
jgi:ribonuclease P protein component